MSKYVKVLSVACNSSLIAVNRQIEAWDEEISKGGYLKGYASGWLSTIKKHLINLTNKYPDYLVDKDSAKRIMGEIFTYFKDKNGNAEINHWTLERDLLPEHMADSLIAMRFNLYYLNKNCTKQLEKDGMLDDFKRAWTSFMYFYRKMEKELLILSYEELDKKAKEKYGNREKRPIVKPIEIPENTKPIIKTIDAPKISKRKNEKYKDEVVKEMYKKHEMVDQIQQLLGNNYCVDGKCINCGECCSLDVAISTNESRKLRKMLKERHIEKYYKMLEEGVLRNECPFRINSKCDIYDSPSKPSICRIYICDAREFQKVVTGKGMCKPEKFMFDILPSEIKDVLNKTPAWINRKAVNGGNR